jgi:PhnB protein
MGFDPYLFFSGGACRAAMTRYQEIFGGELFVMPMSEAPADAQAEMSANGMPAGAGDLIMHAALKVGDHLLMASDDPTGDGGPRLGGAVSYTAIDAGDAKRIFDALAEGGKVTMPLTETFFSPAFGCCDDRWGVPWMVNVDNGRTG